MTDRTAPRRLADKDDRIRLRKDLVAAVSLDSSILLDPKSNAFLGLNPSASFILSQLAAGQTIRETINQLAAEYEIPHDVASRDTLHFVSSLLSHGIVEEFA